MQDEVQELLKAVVYRVRERTLAPIETSLQRDMVMIFRRQGALFRQEWGRVKHLYTESGYDAIDRIFDVVEIETEDGMRRTLERAAADAMGAAITHRTIELGMDAAFGLSNPRALEYLRTSAARDVTHINQTTRQQIHDIIVKGREDRLSYDTIARHISARFEEFAVGKPQNHIDTRAHLVAVTEVAEAYEEGNRQVCDAMNDMGLPVDKRWNNSGDMRVSDGCLENTAAGWIPNSDLFPSGHVHPPRFPGCRCWCSYQRGEPKVGTVAAAADGEGMLPNYIIDHGMNKRETRHCRYITARNGTRIIEPLDIDRNAQKITTQDILAHWDEVPSVMAENVKEILLMDTRNPHDAFWEDLYQIKNFTSFATGGGSRIVFYGVHGGRDAARVLGEIPHTLLHEAGHNLDRAIVDGGRFCQSATWMTAMRRDGEISGIMGEYSSAYARQARSEVEDFADAVAGYVLSPANFTKTYPKRAEVLEDVLGGARW